MAHPYGDQQPLITDPNVMGQAGYPNNQQNSHLQQQQQMRSQPIMNLCWCAASCCIMVVAFIGALGTLVTGQFADTVEMLYLFIIGGALACLDMPIPIKWFFDCKWVIQKYAAILFRLTGKGVVLVFLSTTLFASMWTNLKNPFIRFLAVVLNLAAFGIGVMSFFVGLMKSTKLNNAKEELRKQGPLNQNFSPNALLTSQDFQNLTKQHGGFDWDSQDLKQIMQALTTRPFWLIKPQAASQLAQPQEQTIPVSDLREWTQGGMVLL